MEKRSSTFFTRVEMLFSQLFHGSEPQKAIEEKAKQAPPLGVS